MNWLKEKCLQMFSEPDGKRLCTLRVLGFPFAVMASMTYLFLSCWTVIVGKAPLDYVSFGTGVSAIWVVYSGSIVAKDKLCGGSQP